MLEKQIEHALMKEVKARGGLCIKLVSPSMSGLPDRMVLMHGGNIGFVELKQRGKKAKTSASEKNGTITAVRIPMLCHGWKRADYICASEHSRR